ncbi:hypothetical protein H1R20_g9276, partial [Candolleomyces eurysporus]
MIRRNVAGFCKRGEECWFRHVADDALSPNGKGKEREDDGGSDSESEHLCSICLEKPVTFGLLGGCSHVFCIACIKQWRDPNSKSIDVVSSGNNKKCPMCRTPSNFITPSSFYVKHGTEEKNIIVQMYRESMARVQCRYFEKSIGKSPMCPFGKDCFYKHEKPDGTLHVFQEGASVWMRRYASSRRPRTSLNNLFMFSDSDTEEFAGGFGLFPFDIGSFPFLELFNPTEFENETIRRAVNRASDRQPANPRVEVSVGQFDFSWAYDSLRQIRNDAPANEQTNAQAQDNSDRRANNQQTSRTIQDIGQSLEALTVAMNDGANLDRISQTVQNLQDRLRQENNENGESMERLQILADQMMASIELLQTANVTRLDPTAQREASPSTSPPPLEPISPTTNSSNRSNRRRTTAPVYADDSDDDDMPRLQSISNSSEEYPSDDDDEDFTDSDDDDLRVPSLLRQELRPQVDRDNAELISHLERPAQPANRGNSEAAERTYPSIETLVRHPELAYQLQTAPSSSGQQSASEGPARSLDLSVVTDPSTDTPTSESSSSNASLVTPPPFVTDGRGRVVWTTSSNSSNETNGASASPNSAASPPTSPSSSRAGAPSMSGSRKANASEAAVPAVASTASGGNGGFTTDGRGRVIATNTAPAAGPAEASSARANNASATQIEEQQPSSPTSTQDRSLLQHSILIFSS